jgi:hypothetical protein
MNDNLTDLQSLLNLAAHAVNAEIAEAYQGSTPSFVELKRILTIDPKKETAQSALLKMMTFYFGCDRVPTDQPTGEGSRIYGRTPNVIVGEVRIKPPKKRVNGSPTGYYQIRIPHFLPEKWEALRGYSHAWGSTTLLYTFQSKRQIKVNAASEKDGHGMINHLLKAVDPAFKMGSSEEHSYKGYLAKDKDPPKLTGLTGTANRVSIEYPDRQTTENHLL